jgi:hypothetical protein
VCFENVAWHNSSQPCEKVKHIFAVLLGHAAVIQHSVLAEMTCEDIVEAFEGHYGDRQLASEYCFRLKTRTQLAG